MGARGQPTHGTFWIVGERKGFTCDKVIEQVVRASFVLYAQLPAVVGVFHSDRFVLFEFQYNSALKSLVEGRKSNTLFKRSVFRGLSVVM